MLLYVAAYSSFSGKEKAEASLVTIIEKCGGSVGRANRFIDEHRPKVIDGVEYRAIVFVMPNGFVLRNDVIQLTMRQFKCDWQTAKFHIYRERAINVIGRETDWAGVIPKKAEDQTVEVPPAVVLGEPVLKDVPVV